MTRAMAVGLLLVLLVVLYALMYAGWSRRARRYASAAAASADLSEAGASADLSEPGRDIARPGSDTSEPDTSEPVKLEAGTSEPDKLEPVVLAEGIYVSTTTTQSRHDRVVAGGLGTRARATMQVGARGLSWEREGASGLHLDPAQVVAVSLERGMAGKFVGRPRLVVVAWRGSDGTSYATGFLPRYRADIDRLVAAVERLWAASPDVAPVGTASDGRQ